MTRRHPLSRLTGGLAAGSLAGLAAFAVEWGLAWTTTSPPLPRVDELAAYVACGAVAGALLGLAALAGLWSGAPRAGFASALLAVLALPFGERVFRLVSARLGWPAGLVAVAVAAAAVVLSTALLCRVLPRGRRWPAVAVAAVTVAAVLAVNTGSPMGALGPRALAVDAALVLAALGTVFGLRRLGPRRFLLAAGVVTVVVVAVARLGGGAASSSGSLPATGASGAGRPDLLLVVVDTLRLDVFERVVAETEEGRAFRDELGGAAWFDNALAAAPWTVPSVGSIMTGLAPSEHGLGSRQSDVRRGISRLVDGAATLAEIAAGHGYESLALVTNPVLDPATGIGRGFASYRILYDNAAKLPVLGTLARWGLVERLRYQPASVVRERLAASLRGRSTPERPLFVWLHLMEPHAPLLEHDDLAPDPAARDLPAGERLYRDEVRYLARELAATVRLLKDRGRWERTAFVLTSDHGEMFPTDGHHDAVGPSGEPKSHGHGHALYGELVRVPQIIRPPGGLPGTRRLDVLTTHADLLPTLADLAGLEPPAAAGGAYSLAPWLDPGATPDGATRRRRAALLEANCWGPAQRGLLADALKVIVYPNGERASELYDLSSDPREQADLAAVRPELLDAMTGRLEEAWAELAVADAAETWEGEAVDDALRALGYVQ